MEDESSASPEQLGGYGICLRTVLSLDLETAGKEVFVIAKIDRGGPAYACGLRVDDVIEKTDGQLLLTWDDAARLILGPAETWSQVDVEPRNPV